MNWMRLGQYLYDNRLPIEAGGVLIFTALVKTMPPPGAPFNLYAWFYDFTHQFLNISNSRYNATPSVPAEGLEPKK